MIDIGAAIRWLRAVFPALIVLLPVSAQEAWVEVKSSHFLAYSDAGEARARQMVQEMERMRNVFRHVLPDLQVDAPKPMILIVVRDEATMRRFFPRDSEDRHAKRNAGFFIACPDRNYAVLRMDATAGSTKPFQVLFHEFTHFILQLNYSALPIWLEEGIADFYGGTEMRMDRVMLGKAPTGRLDILRKTGLLPLDALFKVTHDSPEYRDGDKTGLFYSQSWALVHYLLMEKEPQGAGRFRQYLSAFEKHQDSVAAGREAFGDLKALQGTLAAYVRRPRFHSQDYDLPARQRDLEITSRSLDAGFPFLVLGEFLQYSGREQAAEASLKEALRLNPHLPDIHTALGYGHYLRKAYEPAFAAFEEALRLGSTDFRTSYYLAKLALEGHVAKAQPPSWVHDHLTRARALRPDFAGIHMLTCFEYTKDKATAALALEAGRKAVELEPRNLALRSNLGISCMNLDLESEAREVGDQLSQLAKDSWGKEMAKRYQGTLSRYLEEKRSGRSSDLQQEAVQAEAAWENPPPTKYVPRKLRFQLPDTQAALGYEVQRLYREGNTDGAIQKIESALSKPLSNFDRKALTDFLSRLRRGR